MVRRRADLECGRHLEQSQRGIETVHRPELQRLGRDGQRRDPVGGRGDHECCLGAASASVANPSAARNGRR